MAGVTFNNWELTQGPKWMGDPSDRRSLVAGGAMLAASEFPREDAVVVTADGNALAAAESIDVDALSGPIPAGTILDFEGAGKFALVTAAAAAGATSLTVEALPEQIDDGDVATYAGVGTVFVPSGTIIGRTFAERAAGTGFGPVDFTAATSVDDDEVYILAFDVTDAEDLAECELFRHGGLVKENFLPDWDDLDAILQAWVRNNHTAILGTN